MLKKVGVIAFAAAAAAAGASATSSGKFIFTCNALSSDLGCDPLGFDNSYPADFSQQAATSRNGYCRDRAGGPNNGTQEMHWAFKAVRSDIYRVTVTQGGQPETRSVTQYQPGELLDVHVRVMQGSPYMTYRMDRPPGRTGTYRSYRRVETAMMSQRPTSGDHLATAYRGLMMHFQQSSDANAEGAFANATNGLSSADAPTVGGWEIPAADPAFFHAPADCGGDVMFHATGGYKTTYNKFHFRAPAAGTGPIALRSLIKTGDANWGWFWFPNMAGDVVLSEGPEFTTDTDEIVWTRSALGEDCDTVCERVTVDDEPTGCDEEALVTMNSPAAIIRMTGQGNPLSCQLPILSGCGAVGPTSSNDDMCYYADAACAADRDQAKPTCAASSASAVNGRRLCPCNPANDAGAAAPLVTLAAAAVLALSGVSRTTLVVAFALAMVALSSATGEAEAHNWLRSKSRAAFASTAAPFPPRTSDAPHVMVTWDQKFQVEWVLGHTRETYWLITHSSNLDKLSTVRDADLDQYITDRPASQTNLHLETSWRRWHRRRGRFGAPGSPVRPETTNDWRNGDGTYDYRDFFANNNLDDAPPLAGQAADDRLPRSDAFSGAGGIPGSRGGTDGSTYYRLEYRDTDLSLDGRAKYRNPTWPWILEVVRCEHNVNQASRPDVVNIAITRDTQDPTRTPGTGHYLANWRWRGYYDMVDIDLVDSAVPVADVYGEAYTGGAPYRRVEHAVFANPRKTWPQQDTTANTICTEFLGSAEAAIRRCNRVGTTGILACDGVNIWPLYVPTTVSSDLVTNKQNNPGMGFNPMIPWGPNTSYGCWAADFQGAPPGTRVMAAVASRMPFDDRVPPLSISQDPEDLVWHSTAFAKDTGRNFTLRPGSPFANSEPDLSFRYGHKCIADCGALTRYTGYTAPVWTPTDTDCRNCDLEPEAAGNLVTDAAPATEYFLNARCSPEAVTDNSVYKRLSPRGSRNEFYSSNYDCAVMTAADSDCSNWYVRREGESSIGGRTCYCLRAGRTCARQGDGSRTAWEVHAAGIDATTPDPTCARGTRNTAGNRCCPSTCSVAECDSGTGACFTSGTDTLSCSVRGAPCNY